MDENNTIINEEGLVLNDEKTKSISKLTVKEIISSNVHYKATWTTEGLKIPFYVSKTNSMYMLLIPRDEVVAMFKDIGGELGFGTNH